MGAEQVLCLHGIGSSSYTFRNTVRLLGEAGHEAVAVDWLGHGASSKVRGGLAVRGAGGSARFATAAAARGPGESCWSLLSFDHVLPTVCSPPPALTGLATPTLPNPALPLQPTGGFDYTADAYVAALSAFVDALGWRGRPFAVIVQGYVLGQVGAAAKGWGT